jgi:3',5'-cyclic AMP phosphodiesterase CpdA
MRVAHLSDVHLLSLDGARVRDFVNKRWTGGLNILFNRSRHYSVEVFDALVDDLNRQDVDHVVCTGDLTNLAFESEFHFARQHFDRIRIGPRNVTCVPGNHDTYIAEAAGLFEKVFADYCEPDEDWRWSDGARWPVVRVRGEIAIVGLTTSEASGWFMGYGHVGEAQLTRLETVLGDPRLAGKARLVMLHHPPAGKRAKNPRRGLKDHEPFAAIVKRTGAELILHGHEHLDVSEELETPKGPVAVRGIQSGSYSVDKELRRARYRIYTIENGRVTGDELRGWSVAEKRFDYGSAVSR